MGKARARRRGTATSSKLPLQISEDASCILDSAQRDSAVDRKRTFGRNLVHQKCIWYTVSGTSEVCEPEHAKSDANLVHQKCVSQNLQNLMQNLRISRGRCISLSICCVVQHFQMP